MRAISVYVGLVLFTLEGLAYRDFQKEIPNGAVIPSPCNKNDNWPGVGHERILGGGARNTFGADFTANGFQWTPALCQMDSDGDGKTNGQELGDPDCVWTKGASPAFTDSSQLSHPGVCEPINSPSCQGKVEFLKTIDSCRTALNLPNVDWCPAIKSSDVRTLIIRLNETTLDSEETHYICQTFHVPNDYQYHIIAWEPIISNLDIMHHMLFYVCDTPQSERAISSSRNYTTPRECDLDPPECTDSTIGWAYGVEKRCYGSEAGLPMGRNEYKTAILQIHYNNHLKKAGYRDSSGLKLYYTAKKRPNDISAISPSQYDIAIPPQSASTTIKGRAFQTNACSLQKLRGHSSYSIMSMLFHMHKAGSHAKLTLEKQNGTKIVIVDDSFSFDRPNIILWQTPNQPKLEPGDNFLIECTYQTMDRSDWVFFGKTTMDEMCEVALEIYPRPGRADFVEMGATGLYDDCDINSASSSTGDSDSTYICDSNSALKDTIVNSMPSASFSSSCGSSSTPDGCCRFLKQNNFFSYKCVYTLAFEVINRLVGDSANLSEINRIHANIISCISTVQATPLEQQSN